MIPPAAASAAPAIGHRFDRVALAHVAGKGRRAEENQDGYWPRIVGEGRRPVIDYLTAGRLYVVTDGVSGGLRPQEAGQRAAETIGNEYYRLTQGAALDSDPTAALRHAVYTAHAKLTEASDSVRTQEGLADARAHMQAACVCLLLLGTRIYTVHVGDCRAYWWHSARLYQLTEDHADSEGRVNRLLGAELTPERVAVAFRSLPDLGGLQAGDRLLLCSDGIHRVLRNAEINEVLNRREGLASTADGLAAAVYGRGQDKVDDITVILVEMDYDLRRLAEREAESALSPRSAAMAGGDRRGRGGGLVAA